MHAALSAPNPKHGVEDLGFDPYDPYVCMARTFPTEFFPSPHSPFLLSALFHPSYFTQHDWQPEPCFCLCSLHFEAPVSPTVIKTIRVS